MNRKISLFSGIYPPETGGPAKFAQTFSNYVTVQNRTIRVIAYSSKPLSAKLSSVNEVQLIPNNFSIPRKFLMMVGQILLSARSNHAILVNGSFWEVAIARHLRRFRYVAKVPGDVVWERVRNQGKTEKDIDSFQNASQSLRTRTLRYLFSYTLRKAEWVIVPSQHLSTLCESWGVTKEKIIRVNNSVAILPEYKQRVAAARYDFITVCRLVPWKGVDEIIQAASKLDASLLVVGEGPERNSLEILAKSLKAKVTFLGEIPQDQVSIYLKKSSVFVLNSSFEATSYALIEAQANGLLTISNEGTGSEEVITHNVTGLLCGTKSGVSLQQAMQSSLVDNTQNWSMKLNARKSVENNFNIQVNYRKILELCT
jgi:glycosyltransferase involved in cell wall biosynthesis